MASFRRFLRSSAAWTAAPAAALFAASATTARLDAAPATDVAPKQPVEFVGVFLTKDSAAQLKQQYPVKFATTNSSADDALFLVLKYNPSEQEKDAFAPILGASAQLQVQGYVEDDTTQAVLVAATTADGEPLAYDSGAEHAHVLLATAAGDANGLNAGYANVLLERLRASDQLKFLLENDAAADATEWTGELPAFTSTHFPLYSPFPTTTATLVRVEDASSDKKENKTPVLEGTVCLSSSYDAATGTCVADSNGKPECGFCKFMKAGPCGREFSAWEACLDKSKQSGGDFIELCSAPTLALRDCVDANPDYYAILTEDAPADESGDDASMTM